MPDQREHSLAADRLWIVLRLTAGALVLGASAWMLWNLMRDDRLAGLAQRVLAPQLIAAAVVVCILSQILYFSRWHWLLLVLRVPLSWLEALSAAATSQLLGSLAFGAAASDVYRAIANGPRCVGHRVALLASILADRVAGIYSLICLAAFAASIPMNATPQWTALRLGSLPILWSAVAGGGVCILLGLLFDLGPTLALLSKWPAVHALVARVVSSLERFRRAPLAILVAIVAGMVIHGLNATGLWLMAGGLSLPRPPLIDHVLIVALVALTGLLPLPLAGLGAVELLVDRLYVTAVPDARGAGMLASLAFRIVSLGCNAALVALFLAATRIQPAIDRPNHDVSLQERQG